MNIVLVGFMGTGKTEVARKLSCITSLKYISTDELIEKREDKTIKEIFEKYGEGYFRGVEREIIKEVAGLDNMVIDAGGGVMLDEENVKNLKKNGIIVCLRASPEIILERIKDKKDRPLLNVEDKLNRIKELLGERESYYQKADYFIDTDKLNIEQVAEKIKDFLNSATSS